MKCDGHVKMLALAISIAFPIQSFAQASDVKTREEAATQAQQVLMKCLAMPADVGEVQRCVKDCTRAIQEIRTAKYGVPKWLESCRSWLPVAKEAVARTNAQKSRNAQPTAAQQGQARSSQDQKPASVPTKPSAPSQVNANSSGAKPAMPAKSGALRADGAIDWNGYENARTMQAVMVGDFERYRRGSFQVRTFLQFYLDAFEANCAPFLPPDAVVMVRKTIEVTRTAGGFQQENVVDTKRITMAPKFADGYQNYPTAGGAYAAMGGLGDPNAAKNLLTFLRTWSADVRRFFEVEACQGPTMLQMGENLARLTSGRAPLQDESNAAQLLASLRVRVPQAVEDADVRAKRDRADAYWKKQRATWSQPPTITGQGTTQLKINYTTIAPDFEIPIPVPEDRQRIDINVENAHAQRIRWIQLTLGTPPTAPADVPGQAWQLFVKTQSALLEEGVKVLNCAYSNFATLKTVRYWYRESPKSLDRDAMKAVWPDSPMLAIREVRMNCPVVMP